MRVQVAYTVPVEVVVDLEYGTVERVVVIDECMVYDPDEGVRLAGTLEPVEDADVIEVARNLAETGDVWPSWEFGW